MTNVPIVGSTDGKPKPVVDFDYYDGMLATSGEYRASSTWQHGRASQLRKTNPPLPKSIRDDLNSIVHSNEEKGHPSRFNQPHLHLRTDPQAQIVIEDAERIHLDNQLHKMNVGKHEWDVRFNALVTEQASNRLREEIEQGQRDTAAAAQQQEAMRARERDAQERQNASASYSSHMTPASSTAPRNEHSHPPQRATALSQPLQMAGNEHTPQTASSSSTQSLTACVCGKRKA